MQLIPIFQLVAALLIPAETKTIHVAGSGVDRLDTAIVYSHRRMHVSRPVGRDGAALT
jgi:hypothetical protein